MATVKLWRFAFMTRTVMGFLSSSLSLGAGHAPADETPQPPRPRPDRDREQEQERKDRRARIQLRRIAQHVHERRVESARLERQAVDPDAGALNIPGPPGWRRRHSSASHITEYVTQNLRAGVASFVVPPPVELAGTIEDFQSGLVRSISEHMPVVEGSTRTGQVGSFHFVSCVMQPPWGAPRRMVVYTALWAGKGQALLFGTDCHQLFHDHALGVHALVQKIVVPAR